MHFVGEFNFFVLSDSYNLLIPGIYITFFVWFADIIDDPIYVDDANALTEEYNDTEYDNYEVIKFFRLTIICC